MNFIVALILVLLILVGFYLFFYESYFFEINEFDLYAKNTDRNQNIKIVQISDLHLRFISSTIRKVARTCNEIKPDLILFTGDAFEKSKLVTLLDKFLSLLSHETPKIAIIGNWEIHGHSDVKALRDTYLKYNCQFLLDETILLHFKKKTLSVTGVDDFLDGSPDINKALENYQEADYHIVLSHCPGYVHQICNRDNKDIPVDLILSGHTHGGQINLLGYMPHLPRACGQFIKGWYCEKDYQLYVSKGIGWSIFPIRLGARAEVAVFNLYL
ncbi:MAG: metallophosphoesterase [Chitinophagales bacterium]|nr:metallophosphoesterase [Chitinophagales bacterium]